MTDVVVVGGGPAGLSAAATCLAGGLRVVLVDAGETLGGQYWRQPLGSARPDGEDGGGPAPRSRRADHHDPRTFRALRHDLRRAAQGGSLHLMSRHQAWTVTRTGEQLHVHLVAGARAAGARAGAAAGAGAPEVRAPALVLATGAFDRALPFTGWDLPGVLTPGGLQALVVGNGVDLSGRRVLVAGSGPFLLPVAASAARHGGRVVAVLEATHPRQWVRLGAAALAVPGTILEAGGYAAVLARHRIPYRVGAMVVRAHGEAAVTGVDWAPLLHGRPDLTGLRREQVDVVAVGWGFTAHLDLAVGLGCRTIPLPDGTRAVRTDAGLRTDVPGVYAAGEVTGVGGARLAMREGEAAAESVLADLGRRPVRSPGRRRRASREAAARRRFAAALRRAGSIPLGWSDALTPQTVACRCEEVSVGDVTAAVAVGAVDAREVKLLTRAGMGWCQGRMCETGCSLLAAGPVADPGSALGAPAATPRPIAAPLTLGTLARNAAPPTSADRPGR